LNFKPPIAIKLFLLIYDGNTIITFCQGLSMKGLKKREEGGKIGK
jgi:hypothetical protein